MAMGSNKGAHSSQDGRTMRMNDAEAARQARHMAPKTPKNPKNQKAMANLFRAERHAEQTAAFQAPAASEVADGAEQRGEDQRPVQEPLGVIGVAGETQEAPAEETVLISNDEVAEEAENHNSEDDGTADDATLLAPRTASDEEGQAIDGDETPEEPKPLNRKALWGTLGGIAAGLVAIYVGAALYFSNTFMPNTTVNGQDVSGVSRQQLMDSLSQRSSDYQLAVSGQGLNFTVTGADIDLGIDGEAYADEALQATEPWTWPATIWSPRTITADSASSYSQEKLDSLVKAQVDAVNAKAKAPANATLVYDDEANQFEIKPEEMGTLLDETVVQEGATNAVNDFLDAYVADETVLQKPEITSDNDRLKAAQTQANSYLTTEVTLKMNGDTAEVIGSDRIKDWVKIDDSLNPTLDEAAITEWGKNDLSSRLDTINRERTYTRADGKVITVNGGSYGWSIDSASLTPLVVSAVMSGQSQDVDVPILQSAATVPDEGGRDWGNRYIDVDLSEQYVRMYGDDGSLIWESPCVSGDDSQNHNTPTGVWSIDGNFNKNSPSATLVGYKPDGTKDYESYVRYWMPFIGNSIGLHDADWRGSFGGSIYRYNGSHGCVNLPVSAAGDLCSIVQQGDVVITHY